MGKYRHSLIIALLFFASSLQATIYYVDATNGSDSNNGTSESTPWKTLSKINNMASNFAPGDEIKLKCGETWKGERIRSTNHASGTAAAPITYTSYGSGAKPIIDIIIAQSPNWTSKGNNIWSTVTENYARFFRNGVEMLRSTVYHDLGLYGYEYLTNDSNLYIYSTTNPSTDTFSWAKHSDCFRLDNADYVNVVGLDIRGGSNSSLRINHNEGWKISNCNIGKNAAYGIVISYSSDILIEAGTLDANLTVDQSQIPVGGQKPNSTGCEDGIFVAIGSSSITIRNCFFKNWGHASFNSNTDKSSNKISNIKFYNNELTSPDIIYGGRITYSGYSEDGEYYNNYIHDISVANQLGGSRNHFHHNIIDGIINSPLKKSPIGIGIWLQNYNVQIVDNVIENNIIANTESKGFEIYSINWDKPNKLSGNIFRNNILYNCGLTENDIAIQFHEDQTNQQIYNNIVENNLVFSSNTAQTCLFQYNGNLSDVSTFNTQHADIRNNIAGDPLFVDIEHGDYHLQSNSPAIDAGTTTLSTEDYEGNTIPNSTAPDIGAYEYYKPLGIVNNQKNKIVIYPNPTLGEVFLPTQFNNEAYEIYSLVGSVVKSGIVKENSVDLSKLKTGIYLISIIEIETGNRKIAKIVKK